MTIHRKILLPLAVLLAALSSCTGNFTDVNRPGSRLSPEELQRDNYAVGSFLIQMQGGAFP